MKFQLEPSQATSRHEMVGLRANLGHDSSDMDIPHPMVRQESSTHAIGKVFELCHVSLTCRCFCVR